MNMSVRKPAEANAKSSMMAAKPGMGLAEPKLPYDFNALEPHISSTSLENHFYNHHRRYVDRTNALIAGTPLAGASLDDIVRDTARRKTKSANELFNNAAQAWNHAFFWRSMKPGGGGKPDGAIARHITRDFRSYNAFVKKFKKAAQTVFGSGWLWLVVDGDKLKIATTKNAATPSMRGLIPILALDLWEHAYYLDYRSRRDAFVDVYLASLVNWDFANENLSKAESVRNAKVVKMTDAAARPATTAASPMAMAV